MDVLKIGLSIAAALIATTLAACASNDSIPPTKRLTDSPPYRYDVFCKPTPTKRGCDIRADRACHGGRYTPVEEMDVYILGDPFWKRTVECIPGTAD